jgi:hypothetical protein
MLGAACSPCCCGELPDFESCIVDTSVKVLYPGVIFGGPNASTAADYSLTLSEGQVLTRDQYVKRVANRLTVTHANTDFAVGSVFPPLGSHTLLVASVDVITGRSSSQRERFLCDSGSWPPFTHTFDSENRNPFARYVQLISLQVSYKLSLRIVRCADYAANCFGMSLIGQTTTVQDITNTVYTTGQQTPATYVLPRQTITSTASVLSFSGGFFPRLILQNGDSLESAYCDGDVGSTSWISFVDPGPYLIPISRSTNAASYDDTRVIPPSFLAYSFSPSTLSNPPVFSLSGTLDFLQQAP